MASGPELPIRLGGNYGFTSGSGTPTAHLMQRVAGVEQNWGRINVVFLSSSAATFTGWPVGWTKFYDAAVGALRVGVFWTGTQDVNQAAGAAGQQTFTSSAAAQDVSVGQSWDAVDTLAGIVGTPVVVSGTSGGTITVPSLTVPDGCMPLWFIGAKYSASGTSGTIAPPADLNATGSVTPTAAAGMGGRCGGWTSGVGAGNRGLRSPATAAAKTFTFSGGTRTAVAGIAFCVKPADRGLLMAA